MTCLYRRPVKAAHKSGHTNGHDRYRSGFYCHRKWKVVTERECAKCTAPLEEVGTLDLRQHPNMVPSTALPMEGEAALSIRGMRSVRRLIDEDGN